MNSKPETRSSDGKLAANITYFARTLRAAGLRVGPADVVHAVEAVEKAGISTRDDFYWTLHCVLVSRHEDHPVFDEAFRLFWRSRDLVEKMLQMFSPMVRGGEERARPKAGEARVSQALFSGQENQKEVDRPEIELDATFTASASEVLRAKDFAQMTAAEIAEARRQIAEMRLSVTSVNTRRFRPVNRIGKADPRRMMAKAMRTGGDLILPQFKERRKADPPIVILADISGSMSQYSRIFLHFAHALSEQRRHVHTFLFGTRLTNVTRQLNKKDPDEALDQCSKAVEDWSGGTRIGTTLAEFNRLWSRRVLGQGAIVLLVTDGLERDVEDILAREMDRLNRSCRRLIWLNPLLRFEGFQPAARGVRTMLPHVTEFRAVHSLDALSDLCEALKTPAGRQTDPGLWLQSGQAA